MKYQKIVDSSADSHCSGIRLKNGFFYVLTIALCALLIACGSPEEKAEKFYQRAQSLIDEGKKNEAQIEYKNALRNNPYHLQSLLGLAVIEEANGDWPALYRTLQKIVEVDATNIATRIKLTELLLAAGKLDQAMEHSALLMRQVQDGANGDVQGSVQSGVQNNVQNNAESNTEATIDVTSASDLASMPDAKTVLKIKTLRASVLLKVGDRKAGLAQLYQALEIDSDAIDALSLLAIDHMQNGERQQAELVINRALTVDPQHAVLNGLRIRLLTERGDTDAAIVVYQNLIARGEAEQVDTLRRSLVAYLLQIGRVDEAEEQLRERADLAGKGEKQAAETRPLEKLSLEKLFIEKQLDVVRFQYQYRGLEQGDLAMQTLRRKYSHVPAYSLSWVDILFSRKQYDQAKRVLAEMEQKKWNDEEKIEVDIRRARIALVERDFESAKASLDSIFTLDEYSIPARELRARLQLAQGETDLAVSQLRSALSTESDSLALNHVLALAYWQSDRADLAQAQFHAAYKLDRSYTPLIADYARFLMSESRYTEVEHLLEPALKNNRLDSASLAMLTQAKLTLQKWEEAEQLAKQLDQQGTDPAASASLLGLAHVGQEDFDASIAAFERLQTNQPDALGPMTALVRSYLSAGKKDQALAFLNAALERDSGNSSAWLLLALVASGEGKSAQAIASFRSAIEADPKSAAAYLGLAKLYRTGGDVEQALSVLSQGLSALPDDLPMTVEKAEFLIALGRLDQGLSVYQRHLAVQPKAAIVANNLAAALIKRGQEGDYELALSYAEPFKHASVPYFQDTLGWLYFKLGRHDEALPVLEFAAEELAEYAEVRYHLGRVYHALGRMSEARRELQIAERALASGQTFAEHKDVLAMLSSIPTQVPAQVPNTTTN